MDAELILGRILRRKHEVFQATGMVPTGIAMSRKLFDDANEYLMGSLEREPRTIYGIPLTIEDFWDDFKWEFTGFREHEA